MEVAFEHVERGVQVQSPIGFGDDVVSLSATVGPPSKGSKDDLDACCSLSLYIYMVVDLKVLVSSVYDDDPEHIKISFGESFFSSWRK